MSKATSKAGEKVSESIPPCGIHPPITSRYSIDRDGPVTFPVLDQRAPPSSSPLLRIFAVMGTVQGRFRSKIAPFDVVFAVGIPPNPELSTRVWIVRPFREKNIGIVVPF
ncbi:hypothetical protein OPV22_013184 [Ensete ventricosum]|uniref:Uncharacterized protein n=1 Tax=Ensete ventricosum TaxID=4639 RepID=A0AAV8R0G5_ENSVE|nr:hypothetical protein OPV22_013184 [Ensete ventricosum]